MPLQLDERLVQQCCDKYRTKIFTDVNNSGFLRGKRELVT